MTWKPGESGNPEGARVKARRFATILDRVLLQEDLKAEKDHRIRQGIEQQMTKFAEGDLKAGEFVRDSTDGKPAQSVTLAGDPENPLHVIERRVVKKDGA